MPPQIVDIAQVGVALPNRSEWEKFAGDVLGFKTDRSADDAITYCQIDDRHHRLQLTDAAEPAMRYLAHDVGDAATLAAWRTSLAQSGVHSEDLDAATCAERHLAEAIELRDPDGHAIVLGHGFEKAASPATYTRRLAVERLGHVLLTVADTQRTHDFYTQVLGFRLSDWVEVAAPIRLCFLRVNERHHSIAFSPCAPGSKPRLQHVMIEVAELDDVMRSYHHARLSHAPIGMGPGKHPNCATIHCYVQTPGGFAIEFGYGHRRLDEATYEPVVFPPGTPVDVWGGDIQSPEFQLG